MKTITFLAATLMFYFLCVDHIRPCRRLEKSISLAVQQRNYLDALQIPYRVLEESPCLCTHRAKSGLAYALEQSLRALTRDTQPDVSSGIGILDKYQRLASGHGVSTDVPTRLTEALAARGIEEARARADRGEYDASLELLDVVGTLPVGEKLEVRREGSRVRFLLARHLAQQGASEEALSELGRVIKAKETDTAVRDNAQQLAASVSENVLSQRLRSGDFDGALKFVDDARQIVADEAIEQILEVFDRAAYGRALQGDAITERPERHGEASTEIQIHNDSKSKLYVLLRGPSRGDVTIPAGSDKTISLKPGKYMVGAYAPKDPGTRAYRGITRIHYGHNVSGFTQSSGAELEPTSNTEY